MLEARLWILAVVFLALFAILGILVMSTHALSRLDAAAAVLRDHATGLATIFTLSGRALPLLALGLVSVLLFLFLKRPLWIPLAIFASQIASQSVVELLIKPIFARPRPTDSVLIRDLGFSFPSGHSTTAIVFFGAWLLVVILVPIARPLKFSLAALLFVWMLGIDWSRIALSAHYLSDVLGGTLFGCAWMSALLALLVRLRVPLTWDMHG